MIKKKEYVINSLSIGAKQPQIRLDVASIATCIKYFHKPASRQVMYNYINTKSTVASNNGPFSPGTKRRRGMGVAHSQLENLPLCSAKMVVQCTSKGQLTGPRTIGNLL